MLHAQSEASIVDSLVPVGTKPAPDPLSGNLTGAANGDGPVGTFFRDASSLAREHTETAVRVLAEVMEDPFAENKDRLKAAESILDRGHGKPAQAIIQLPASRQLARQLAALSDDDLMQVIQSHELPRLATQAVVVDVDSEPDPLLR